MTTSNRFANRLFLVVAGLVTLLVGAALILVALPGGGFARDAVRSARDAQSSALAGTSLSDARLSGSGSYLPWLLAVLCLIVVVIGIIAASTRGAAGSIASWSRTTRPAASWCRPGSPRRRSSTCSRHAATCRASPSPPTS
ncbi:hypothetical protein GCM10025867_04870 [Frondihabitans sucicola]|uniref:Uncharacterized protein n=1 Tax=Frondihabitans sucicola TaxID=1268041 RepID=A0ABM8GJA0_9MICO|nr:hypothetical protein [Frondihabitans sucicola]BDZ48246.1 hypothetical protein GCM10025867_04870 [Frondihabitans sucicola]